MAVKAQAAATTTKAAAKGTIEQFLKTRTDEQLIHQGVAAMSAIAHATAERDAILAELELRFPGEKTSEFIITEYGVAERQVVNAWVVDPTRIDELKDVLGPARYAEYINESRKVKCPDERAEELEKILGESYKLYFIEVPKYAVTAAGRAALRDDAKLTKKLRKAITIVPDVKVKIKPVEK